MKSLKNINYLLLFLLGSVLVGACKEDEVDMVAQELKIIEEFMLDRGMDITPTQSGLYYQDELIGIDETVGALDTVDVYYTGYFLSGIQFDSNIGGDVFTFVVQDVSLWVIAGFDEGLSYMREGGKSKMIIPSWLGYGTSGNGQIPGYTPLFFEIELVEIRRGPGIK